MRNKHLFISFTAILILLLAFAYICFASTTFNARQKIYFGKESAAEKLVVSVTPVHRQDVNDHNDVNSVATSTADIYGELKRITIAATGTDTDFTVIVKDEMGIELFNKGDCSTASLPVSYNLGLDPNNIGSTRPSIPGILVAGPITVETNDVNAVDLTDVNVTLYYWNIGR